MNDDMKSVLSFNNYVVDNIEFRRNKEYKKDASIEVDFDLKKNVVLHSSNKSGSVSLTTTLFQDPEKNNYPFYMQVKVTGFFAFDSEQEDEFYKNVLNRNAVAILFPYIRALISTYTANANVQPLILPPINVTKL